MPRIGKFSSVLLSLGNAEAVYVLLQTGANIFSIDKEDRTVLYWAAMQNHQNVIDVRNLSYPVTNCILLYYTLYIHKIHIYEVDWMSMYWY